MLGRDPRQAQKLKDEAVVGDADNEVMEITSG